MAPMHSARCVAGMHWEERGGGGVVDKLALTRISLFLEASSFERDDGTDFFFFCVGGCGVFYLRGF